ncbi:hypothetical protein GDO81_028236 [Engystomops pustulosus]|uniref:Secreted protein n=1 Tax=Engystomops pustulosus TaxID=76066 RepID=A0AAV6YJX2_ENGPU|nr:hypothetical protein GDO81_028236 [Engystomops pustulosus]
MEVKSEAILRAVAFMCVSYKTQHCLKTKPCSLCIFKHGTTFYNTQQAHCSQKIPVFNVICYDSIWVESNFSQKFGESGRTKF